LKAQMHNYNLWIPNVNVKALVEYLKELLETAEFTIVGFTEYEFTPQGYSCAFLLSESHLAIHTFPEEDSINIQLSSCVPGPFLRFTRDFSLEAIKLLGD